MMAGQLSELRHSLSTVRDTNVIIVHDYKDDQTGIELRDILNEFQNPQIILVEGKFGSPGQARNAGMSQATSEWISFWDADDLADATKFKHVIQSAKTDTDVVVGQYAVNYQSEARRSHRARKTLSVSDLAVDLGIWRMIFKKTIIADSLFSDLLMGEDQLFFLDILRNNPIIEFSDEIIYSYSIGSKHQLTNTPQALSQLTILMNRISNQTSYNSRKFEEYRLLLEIRQLSAALSSKYVSKKILLLKSFLIKFATSRQKFLYSLAVLSFLRRILTQRYDSNFTTVLNGGLGNQLFQLAYSLAETDGKINLNSRFGTLRKNKQNGLPDIMYFWLPLRVQLDWNNGRGLLSRKMGNLFLGLISNSTRQEKSSNIKFPKWINLLVAKMFFKQKTMINLFNSRNLEGGDPHTLNFGYFQSSMWASLPHVQKSLRDLRPRYLSEDVLKLIRNATQVQPLVMHIRLGDYLDEPDFGNLSPNYYSKSTKRIREIYPLKEIWIFSDDERRCKKFLAQVKVENFRYIDTKRMNPAEVIEIMKYGSGFVLANSSFSWWAGFLRITPASVVVAPKPWFRNIPVSQDLVPRDWITQDSEWT
jgi:glycosyltransferase involved in cell wall biosynthesis